MVKSIIDTLVDTWCQITNSLQYPVMAKRIECISKIKFRKSMFISRSFRFFLAAWMLASAPTLTPQPSCLEVGPAVMSSTTIHPAIVYVAYIRLQLSAFPQIFSPRQLDMHQKGWSAQFPYPPIQWNKRTKSYNI